MDGDVLVDSSEDKGCVDELAARAALDELVMLSAASEASRPLGLLAWAADASGLILWRRPLILPIPTLWIIQSV